MKRFFLLAYSLASGAALGSSCCVSNTGLPNLMVLPVKWQQTFTFSQSRIIGDTDTKGSSTFRNDGNRDTTTTARMDLSYGWTWKYQTGLSLRYQNREREVQGQQAGDSGWSDVEVSQAWRPWEAARFWIFQTLNIPTAKSNYDSREELAVDARGSGTYRASLGAVHFTNYKEWELMAGPEVHRSFDRAFGSGDDRVEVQGSWGAGLSLDAAYVPWRSKTRYGAGIAPRLETPREITTAAGKSRTEQSLVWDTSLNITHTFTAQYAMGVSYVDQTLFGPARNTMLGRTFGIIFQAKWW